MPKIIPATESYKKDKELGTVGDNPILNLRTGRGLSDGCSDFALSRQGFMSVVYACITLIARTIAQNEVKLFKMEGGKPVVVENEDDEILVLLNRPNPYMDWFDFVYLLQVMYEIYGERFIYVVRNKFKVPKSMWVVPSFAIKPIYNPQNPLEIQYFISAFKPDLKFTTDEIVFDFIPSVSGRPKGESPLRKILTEVDIHNFAKRYIKAFYKNGAIPFGILSVESQYPLSDREREEIKRAWATEHQGVDKAWKIAVISAKANFQEISVRPSQDFINQSRWTVYDILAIYNVPPLKLGYTENINRTTAREQNLIFARDCIKPRLIKLQSLFNNKILPALGAKNYRIEFETPIPEDMELNVQRAKIGATFGVLTINEIRRLLGFRELDDDKLGEQLIEPLNLPEGRKPEDEKILNEILQIDRALRS